MEFERKQIRLKSGYYRGRRSYFITFCCAGRRPIFANAELASWLIQKFREGSVRHRFDVRAYCAMPDHFHALVLGLSDASNLIAFVKDVKQFTGREYSERFGGEIWQTRFYDHILRERDSSIAVSGYIWMNPVRKGLCDDPRDYPHSGSFTMDWKKALGPIDSWTPEWKKKVAGSGKSEKLKTPL